MVKRLNQHIGKKGTAAVEFAIVLPFLVLLIFGTIEFGLMFYNKQVITNASREGARAGITGILTVPPYPEVQQIVLDYCNNKFINLNGSNALQTGDIVVAPDGADDLSVTVSFNYNLLFSQIIGINNTMLSARTIMRMEPGSGP